MSEYILIPGVQVFRRTADGRSAWKLTDPCNNITLSLLFLISTVPA